MIWGGGIKVEPHFFLPPETRYLPIGRRDEAEKLIYVADVEPVRKQLHRRLHLLGDEKILDGFRHPSAAESGGGTRGGNCQFGVQSDATNLKLCTKILFWGLFFPNVLMTPSCPSPGEAAADQDAPQGVLLAPHHHGGAHLQISEGIEAGSTLRCLPGHVAEIRTLDGEGKKGDNGLKRSCKQPKCSSAKSFSVLALPFPKL